MEKQMKVYLAKPRGFCAGVDRAIDVVEIALDIYGPPVYVRHEIVHNDHVVNELRGATGAGLRVCGVTRGRACASRLAGSARPLPVFWRRAWCAWASAGVAGSKVG